MCPVSKWCSRGLAGVMHNKSFSKSLRKKWSLLLPKLKNLSKLKRPKTFLRRSLSLRLKKAPKKLKRLNHSHLRGNIKRKVIEIRNSMIKRKKLRQRQKKNHLRRKKLKK